MIPGGRAQPWGAPPTRRRTIAKSLIAVVVTAIFIGAMVVNATGKGPEPHRIRIRAEDRAAASGFLFDEARRRCADRAISEVRVVVVISGTDEVLTDRLLNCETMGLRG